MRKPCRRGYSLVEVLVALLVLGVGVLGACALQAAALRARADARLMDTGMQLAASLAEHMRANPAQMRQAEPINPYLGLDFTAGSGAPPAPVPSCDGAQACDGAQLAAYHSAQVRLAVHEGFPGGRVRVCRDAQPWEGAPQGYRWDCTGGADAPVVIKLGWQGRDGGRNDLDDPVSRSAPRVALAVAARER
ncbi:MAG: type IV pilus modification protein PilV [Pseudomonadota bacterium]